MIAFDRFKKMINEDNHIKLQKQLKNEPQIVHATDESRWTLLMYAIRSSSFLCAKVLIEANSNVNALAIDDSTALMHSSCLDDLCFTEMLIAAGADVHQTDCDGWNAFMYAMINEKVDNATFLIKKGIDLTHREHRNKSAFEIALQIDENFHWITFFHPYKDRLDDQDLALYHEKRLQLLLH
jgi:ankyrin repeat protein